MPMAAAAFGAIRRVGGSLRGTILPVATLMAEVILGIINVGTDGSEATLELTLVGAAFKVELVMTGPEQLLTFVMVGSMPVFVPLTLLLPLMVLLVFEAGG